MLSEHRWQVDLDASAAQLQATEAQAQVQALASENQQLRAALVEGLQVRAAAVAVCGSRCVHAHRQRRWCRQHSWGRTREQWWSADVSRTHRPVLMHVPSL